MPRKKCTVDQITLVVRELEEGTKVEYLCRIHDISEVTSYNRCDRYFGLGPP